MQYCQSGSDHVSGRALPIIRDLGLGALCLLASTALLWSWFGVSLRVPLLAMITYLVMAGLILASVPAHWRGLGWANRITLWRGTLITLLAGTLADPDLLARYAIPLTALALLVLVLDGVDGWVARCSSTQSDFGARFDMELDAFLILVLCLALLSLGKAGPWVLAIGVMRYAFVITGLKLSWLTAALPESRRRKAVCVWQVAALMIALLPVAGATATNWLAGSALAGLTWSFIIDICWLYRHARRGGQRSVGPAATREPKGHPHAPASQPDPMPLIADRHRAHAGAGHPHDTDGQCRATHLRDRS